MKYQSSGRNLISFFMVIIGCVLTSIAHANLTIEINQGNMQAVPVAVVPFASNASKVLPVDISAVISNDLKFSGQFSPISQDDFLSFPSDVDKVYYPDWKKLNVRYLVIGKINYLKNGDYRINYDLFNIDLGKSVLSGYVEGGVNQLRPLAHSISDQIYNEITGVPGIFSTKLLYVIAKNKGTDKASYKLVYADIDGHRPVMIVHSSEPIVSPCWSADHKQVAYTTYINNREQVIYLQELATGKRHVISPKGYVFATSPAFSPNGMQLAMVLSKGQGTNIYIKSLRSGKLKQLTFGNITLNSEPAWTPDGKQLIFTSNRGGTGQIYEINIGNKHVQRITYEGKFNARGRVFPDGKKIAMVTKGVGEKAYHIAVLDLRSGDMHVLSTEPFEDSPSISPNGKMLVFSAQKGLTHVLGIVTADGRASYTLPASEGDVQEPAWSPYF